MAIEKTGRAGVEGGTCPGGGGEGGGSGDEGGKDGVEKLNGEGGEGHGERELGRKKEKGGYIRGRGPVEKKRGVYRQQELLLSRNRREMACRKRETENKSGASLGAQSGAEADPLPLASRPCHGLSPGSAQCASPSSTMHQRLPDAPFVAQTIPPRLRLERHVRASFSSNRACPNALPLPSLSPTYLLLHHASPFQSIPRSSCRPTAASPIPITTPLRSQ